MLGLGDLVNAQKRCSSAGLNEYRLSARDSGEGKRKLEPFHAG
jgi:hypothetical protein